MFCFNWQICELFPLKDGGLIQDYKERYIPEEIASSKKICPKNKDFF